jgi:hypothetical protein
MPNMSIALKTLRPQQIARASTSLSIIQQVAASIGTAMLSIILFNEVKDRLAPVRAQLQATAPPGTQPDMPEQTRQLLAGSMADAYASSFVWALALLALALIPSLLRLRDKAPARPAAGPADKGDLRVPEPVSDGARH